MLHRHLPEVYSIFHDTFLVNGVGALHKNEFVLVSRLMTYFKKLHNKKYLLLLLMGAHAEAARLMNLYLIG